MKNKAVYMHYTYLRHGNGYHYKYEYLYIYIYTHTQQSVLMFSKIHEYFHELYCILVIYGISK